MNTKELIYLLQPLADHSLDQKLIKDVIAHLEKQDKEIQNLQEQFDLAVDFLSKVNNKWRTF